MPLIELEPPSTLPAGQTTGRLPSVGSGSDRYFQLSCGLAIAFISPAGIRIDSELSAGPASSSSTLCRPDPASRLAMTDPADPAPTTMKSQAMPDPPSEGGLWHS